jgi:DNA-binding GntR family transcriptional regulator
MATRSTRTPAQKADLAYKAMRRAIMEQALTPGTKLPEDQLGEQFGVSRTLIRTVLGRLAAEALVQIGNKRTATVAQPSLEEARAVFEVRRCLEAQAVRMLIERWQPSMGATLEGHLREEQQAAQAGAKPVSIRLAGEFHTRLAQMTGNPLLERYMAEVVTRCSLILAAFGRPHSPDCGCTEHQQLIAAFRARDAELAVQLMHEHLHGIERRALLPDAVHASAGLTDVLSRYSAELTASDAALALHPSKKIPSPVAFQPTTKRSSS